MKIVTWTIGAVAIVVAMTSVRAQGPGRPNSNWPTVGGDAQRTSWMRNEVKLSAAAMAQPGFQLLWNSTLENQPSQLNALTQPLLLQNLISHKGFKALAFVGGSADVVYAIDYDLNRVYWKQSLSSAVRAPNPTATCPGGLTSITRAASVFPSGFPGAPPAPGGPGGGGAPRVNARGVNLNNLPINSAVYALSSGGMLHFLNPHVGTDIQSPVRFLPPNAKAAGLIAVDSVLYVATLDGCGGVPNGIWAMDVGGENKTVTSWQSDRGNLVGLSGPTFGFDGTIFTVAGSSVVALEAKTLVRRTELKGESPFTTAPVAFRFNERNLLAAGSSDARVHLFEWKDGSILSAGASPAYGAPTGMQQALATWEEPNGTRWVLAPSTSGMAAFKLVDSNGRLSLDQGWKSREFGSPVVSAILNDVVFAVATGLPPASATTSVDERIKRATGAVLVALDGRTGKELWTSGKTMASFNPGIPPSAGDSQVYVVTHDGTLYAFGLPQER